MSKWHVQPLSDSQKSYAATDAYVRSVEDTLVLIIKLWSIKININLVWKNY